MKNTIIISTIILITAMSAFSQDRPRYFDNFDTSAGVRIQQTRPQPSPTPSVQTTRSAGRPQVHYPPSPPFGAIYKNRVDNGPVISPQPAPPLVRKTAQVTMAVNEGYYQRDRGGPTDTSRMVMNTGLHLRGYTTGDSMIDAFIVDSSTRYSIDPLLIYSQMNQESSFKLKATSNKGASGLMQLMPATARRMGVVNIYDPRENIEGGVKYMRLLLDMFNGDINLALAGYNAGEGAVIKYGYQIPPYTETQDYVRRISSRYRSIAGTESARMVRPPNMQNPPITYRTQVITPAVYTPVPIRMRSSDGTTRLVYK